MSIGIDHGFGWMKTSHVSFPAGIVPFDHEPHSMKQTLQYKNRYYVCGSGRQALKRDKTADESYALLTLAAIAEELRARGGVREATVTLAAGLPLTQYGLEKVRFRSYLLSFFAEPVRFRYEDERFEIAVKDVLLYPQGYAAVMGNLPRLMREPSTNVIDIGSWTTDAMRLDYGRVNAETCRSLEHGMIRCVGEVQEQVRRGTGLSLTEAQVEQMIRSGALAESEDDPLKQIAAAHVKRYAKSLLGTIMENGFDINAVPTTFLGGGAALVLYSADRSVLERSSFIDDIHANAKGYEQIAGQVCGNA